MKRLELKTRIVAPYIKMKTKKKRKLFFSQLFSPFPSHIRKEKSYIYLDKNDQEEEMEQKA